MRPGSLSGDRGRTVSRAGVSSSENVQHGPERRSSTARTSPSRTRQRPPCGRFSHRRWYSGPSSAPSASGPVQLDEMARWKLPDAIVKVWSGDGPPSASKWTTATGSGAGRLGSRRSRLRSSEATPALARRGNGGRSAAPQRDPRAAGAGEMKTPAMAFAPSRTARVRASWPACVKATRHRKRVLI